jgi:hypothetical protein
MKECKEQLLVTSNNRDTNHGGVFVSYDGGVSWSEYAFGWTTSIAVVSK